MISKLKTIAVTILLHCFIVDAGAIILHEDAAENPDTEESAVKNIALNCALRDKDNAVADFPYWEHIGMVGMGSGIYLGDGWVLTSAHVGCAPFKMSDGSYYKPIYDTWRVFQNPDGRKADLAVFRVQLGDGTSSLARLGRLPIGQIEKIGDPPLIMIGTGFIEKKPQSAGTDSKPVLGYQMQSQREKRWAFTSLEKVLEQPALTAGGCMTACFVSCFQRDAFHGQAADGDSGGAMFSYNSGSGQWELVGCIFAVSQLGTYVPFGARTYVGNIDSYRSQLPVMQSLVIALAH